MNFHSVSKINQKMFDFYNISVLAPKSITATILHTCVTYIFLFCLLDNFFNNFLVLYTQKQGKNQGITIHAFFTSTVWHLLVGSMIIDNRDGWGTKIWRWWWHLVEYDPNILQTYADTADQVNYRLVCKKKLLLLLLMFVIVTRENIFCKESIIFIGKRFWLVYVDL